MKLLILILLFLISFASSANEKCELTESIAINNIPDYDFNKIKVHATTKWQCFNKAMQAAESSKRTFHTGRRQEDSSIYLYHGFTHVKWVFKDSIYFNSMGYVSRHTRKCIKKEMAESGIGDYDKKELKDFHDDLISAEYLLYFEDCATFNHY